MASKQKNLETTSFEDAMASLEGILEKLESSELKLDELVSDYSLAKKYLAICKKRLEDAELKISKISEDSSSEEFIEKE
ncbi:MAG: exodeoxyribonuclease VII small subunit [Opitutales bacterium]|nr:exodeoxyribonuclease VII small subunit [Opitutales bacterium]